MNKSSVGIDISKKDFTASFLYQKQYRTRSFLNNQTGFQALLTWLPGNKNHFFAMEATGGYEENLAVFLHHHGYTVGIINPFQMKSFSQTMLKRHKTDKIDSTIIAQYSDLFDIREYIPQNPKLRELRQLYRCSQDMIKHITSFKNHLEGKDRLGATVTKCWGDMLKKAQAQLARLEKKMIDLIESIPTLKEDFDNLQTIKGIGSKTAVALLSELPDMSQFNDARALAAFAGLTPRHYCSGSSVNKRSQISKVGSSSLRHALYFPAIVAKNRNPLMMAFANRLEKNHKCKKVIITAVMRKLLHIVFAIIKNKTTFDSNYLENSVVLA